MFATLIAPTTMYELPYKDDSNTGDHGVTISFDKSTLSKQHNTCCKINNVSQTTCSSSDCQTTKEKQSIKNLALVSGTNSNKKASDSENSLIDSLEMLVSKQDDFLILTQSNDELSNQCALYQCKVCQKGSNDWNTYYRHRRTHANMGVQFKCLFCKRMFRENFVLKYHVHIHRQGNLISHQLYLRSNLNEKLKSHSGRRFFSVLPRLYVNKPSFRKTCAVDSAITGSCSQKNPTLILNKSAIDSNQKDSYKSISDKPELPVPLVYKCNVCQRRFKNENHYLSHIPVHNSERFKCLVCQRLFLQQSYLVEHIKAHEAETLVCQICGKTFSRYRYFKLHLSSHSREMLICQVCGKGLTTSAGLKVHIRTHTGERPYHCVLCSEKFRYTKGLNEHIRRKHTKEKPNSCRVCEKKFSTKTAVKRHMKTHTGERPYICEYCGKGFSQKENLRGHIRMHKDIRPYECDQCDRAFVYKHVLQQHQLTHSKEH